ncbi:MAG TPA: pyruvate:ferredoxin (flavodoxin) oxidoreductase, partial [Thermoanaerobaculia bacterium]|nr:pyruvate:ferredoxin (flavodoxin) oxidoreductase [Thermoanaerobaculia bacterium]
RANFIACHQEQFLDRYDVLEAAVPGAVFLLNTEHAPAELWDQLPLEMQEQILEKHLKVWLIDAYKVAKALGMGGRINTIMQTCFFAISGVLPREEAIAQIKKAIEKTYGKKGEETVRRNFAAVDGTLANLAEMAVPVKITSTRRRPPIVSDAAPDFVKRVSGVMLEGKGDLLPVSAFPPDGTWPLSTAQWEKRNIALEIPVWDEKICIQCNKCAMVCPHAAIRAKVFDPAVLKGAPKTYKSVPYKGTEYAGKAYTIQIAPEDCTGCTLCVAVCPAKDKANPKHKSLDMAPQKPLRDAERDNFAFFLDLPEADRTKVRLDVKGAQFLQPLFEFSGACAGCGETPYVKLLTQLFGDRALIANATGCSSIYGGNLPTTPYRTNAEGRGPAWSNSLFEDNAEFGLGFRLALDSFQDQARTLVKELAPRIGQSLAGELLTASQETEAEIAAQRERVLARRTALKGADTPEARRLLLMADSLVKKSVWIVGGDGWAYDIGYGGLDHVLASGRKVNILVLDTEVYSNTGGQQSKATPLGAAAKFAAKGKSTPKKDLGMLAMTYGNVYVAHVAFGAKDAQTVKALLEAESYPGTSIVIAYSPCIAHGYDLSFSLDQQKLASESGYWPLYRFDPRRISTGETPLLMDTAQIKGSIAQFMRNEARFRMVEQQDAPRFLELLAKAEREVRNRFQVYENLA